MHGDFGLGSVTMSLRGNCNDLFQLPSANTIPVIEEWSVQRLPHSEVHQPVDGHGVYPVSARKSQTTADFIALHKANWQQRRISQDPPPERWDIFSALGSTWIQISFFWKFLISRLHATTHVLSGTLRSSQIFLVKHQRKQLVSLLGETMDPEERRQIQKSIISCSGDNCGLSSGLEWAGDAKNDRDNTTDDESS